MKMEHQLLLSTCVVRHVARGHKASKSLASFYGILYKTVFIEPPAHLPILSPMLIFYSVPLENMLAGVPKLRWKLVPWVK